MVIGLLCLLCLLCLVVVKSDEWSCDCNVLNTKQKEQQIKFENQQKKEYQKQKIRIVKDKEIKNRVDHGKVIKVNSIYWLQKDSKVWINSQDLKQRSDCPNGYSVPSIEDYQSLFDNANLYVILFPSLLNFELKAQYVSSNKVIQMAMDKDDIRQYIYKAIVLTRNQKIQFNKVDHQLNKAAKTKCIRRSFESNEYDIKIEGLKHIIQIQNIQNINIKSSFRILRKMYDFNNSTVIIDDDNKGVRFVPTVIGCSKILINIQLENGQILNYCKSYFSEWPQFELSDSIEAKAIKVETKIVDINNKKNYQIYGINNQFDLATRSEGGFYLGFTDPITQKIMVKRLTEQFKTQWKQQIDLGIVGNLVSLVDTQQGFAILYQYQLSQNMNSLVLAHFDFNGNKLTEKIIFNNYGSDQMNTDQIKFYFKENNKISLEKQLEIINSLEKAKLVLCGEKLIVALVHSNKYKEQGLTMLSIDIFKFSEIRLAYYQPNEYLIKNVLDFEILFDHEQYLYLIAQTVKFERSIVIFKFDIFKTDANIIDPTFLIKNRIQRPIKVSVLDNLNATFKEHFQCGVNSEPISCLRISSLFFYQNWIGFIYSLNPFQISSSQGTSNLLSQIGWILLDKSELKFEKIQKMKQPQVDNIQQYRVNIIKQQMVSRSQLLVSLIYSVNEINGIFDKKMYNRVDINNDKQLDYLLDLNSSVLMDIYALQTIKIRINQISQYQLTRDGKIVWIDNNGKFLLNQIKLSQSNTKYLDQLVSLQKVEFNGFGYSSIQENKTQRREEKYGVILKSVINWIIMFVFLQLY